MILIIEDDTEIRELLHISQLIPDKATSQNFD